MASWISLTPTGKSVFNAISSLVQKGQNAVKEKVIDSGLYDSIVHASSPRYLVESGKQLQKYVKENGSPNGFAYADAVSMAAPSTGLKTSSAEDVAETSNSTLGRPGSGSGFSAAGSGSAPARTNNSQKSYVDLINEITDKNNAWAAAQAQKQMDFQERMARNAHQYEIEDLKAAGLNPVLSAGAGGGAATPSGAMATPDTSNTRLIAELAFNAVEGLSNAATGLSYGFNRSNQNITPGKFESSGNQGNKNLDNLIWKTIIPTVVRKMI